MPSIGTHEIQPGLVVFMDTAALSADDRVGSAQNQPVFRSGPFLCVAVEGEESTWTCVTTEERAQRLPLDREWRSGGHPQWLRADQYLNDGANVWHGPTDAFVAASHREATTDRTRALLSPEGVAAVLAEIEAQVHRRDRPCGDAMAQASSIRSGFAGS